MNNHNPTPLKDFSAYLDHTTYIGEDGKLNTEYIQKATPELPINDPDIILSQDDDLEPA